MSDSGWAELNARATIVIHGWYVALRGSVAGLKDVL